MNNDFILENGTLTNYHGPGGDVVLPEGITEVGREAFFHCDGLTGVSVPAGVTKISHLAFANCVSLAEIRLPAGLKALESHAFFRCLALAGLDIPDTVAQMGISVFSHCTGLKSVRLPASISQVSAFAFFGCSRLIQVEIPEGVSQIRERAFAHCVSLARASIPKTVTSIDKTVFTGSDPAILAPHIPVGQFDKANRAQAIRGFALAWAENRPMEQQDRDGYLQYIRRQRKRLYPLAVRHPALLKLMLTEQIVPPHQVPLLLDLARQAGSKGAEQAVLAYSRQSDNENSPEMPA